MKLLITGQLAKDAICKHIQSAPIGHEVIIQEAKRKEPQSKKFHATCGDVAKQLPYLGRMLSKDQWKVLFVSGHAIATGLGAEVVPGLENEFVNIRESTADMRGKRMTSLIEYMLAYCADHDIRITTNDLSQ